MPDFGVKNRFERYLAAPLDAACTRYLTSLNEC
jgi:hypothetical protein